MPLDNTNVCRYDKKAVQHDTYTTHRLDSIRYLQRQLQGSRQLQRRRIHRSCHHNCQRQHQDSHLCSGSQRLGRSYLCCIFCRLCYCQCFQLRRICNLICLFRHQLCCCKSYLYISTFQTRLTFSLVLRFLRSIQQAQLCHWCRIQRRLQRCQLHEHSHKICQQLCIFSFQKCIQLCQPCCFNRRCRCCRCWIRRLGLRCWCCCYGFVNQ
jgi:hypothetical protein